MHVGVYVSSQLTNVLSKEGRRPISNTYIIKNGRYLTTGHLEIYNHKMYHLHTKGNDSVKQ